MNAQQFWNIYNVNTFRGFDVSNGEISLSNNEYRDHLNDIWGTVTVCGQDFDQGDLFEDADPTAFRCGKSEYESQLQTELVEQLENEASDDIDFIEGDEWDLSDDDEEEESDDE